jgi:ribosomal protein S18 acetylase RimI-like enzyme
MITHKNIWWWGVSYTLIAQNGVGVVDIQFDYDMPNTGYIKRLSVLENYRKEGLGTELINACTCIAVNKGMKFLQLDVQFDNEWLVNWYKRLGFEILSREENTYVMIKSL